MKQIAVEKPCKYFLFSSTDELIILSLAKSIGCKRKNIQFP